MFNNFSMDNCFQISITKYCKFSIYTIFILWMAGLPCSGKTTSPKNLEKQNIKNVIYIEDLWVDILQIGKKVIMNSYILTKYRLVPKVSETNYIIK